MARKQAVLLIHGIGEQRPMDTLRGFVDAVWSNDESVHNTYGTSDVFSKPDTVSGNFELRRLTTGRNAAEIRTDFFEFYWAHLMSGNTLTHVIAWAKLLLLRPPWKVPKQLRGAWLLLVALTLAIVVLLVQTFLPESWRFIEIPKWATGGGSVALALLGLPVINTIVGDAARYLHPAPNNIARRQEIRAKGVELLQKLHEDQHGYERIIVVGHSLGSVIGYDIITHAWVLHHASTNDTLENPVLDDFENGLGKQNLDAEEIFEFQRAAHREMREREGTWKVTDFLTLGSPLAHAEILLAEDAVELDAKQAAREFPTSPPQLEKERCSYPAKSDCRTFHHAAPFAVTRWTNLYFPEKFLIVGDFVGGKLAPIFGDGVRDIAVKTSHRFGLLSHTLYWTAPDDDPDATHIARLRAALDLLDEGDAE